MRRASGPQTGSTFFIRKETSNKNKSPNVIKAKSRGKIVHQSTSSNMMSRKNNSFSKTQQNQSSTYFTTKQKKSLPENKKLKEMKKYEKQIMQILHTSAAIIQRQWRKYLIRQYQKRLLPERRKIIPVDPPLASQFDSVSAKTSQISEAYNNKKYYSSQLLENKKVGQNSFNKNVFSFNLSGNKQSKFMQSPEKSNKGKGQQPNFTKSVVDVKHNRTRSDQTLPNLVDVKIVEQREQKNLGITPKIINLVIESKHEEVKQKYDDHFIKAEKGSLDEVLRKLQTKLQQKKLKRILALENSFSNNLLTFRSYKKNIQSVSEEHDKKLTILQNKKKHLLAKLNEFVSLCEKNIEELKFDDQPKYEAGELKSIQKINQNQEHHLDISFNDDMSGFHSRSLMLDEWDLDAQFSDKKIVTKHQTISKDKKSHQILIDDAQRQVTIIDDLTRNEIIAENDQEETSDKNKISPKEIIFSTPPKSSQINASSEEPKQIGPIKTNLQQKDEQILMNYPIEKNQIQKQERQLVEVNVEKQNIKKKNFSEFQVENELKKFHPIKPNIDIVNNWLLQISHFILDNFSHEFTRKLVQVEQPSHIELLKHCAKGEPFHREYISISHKIFKQFEFFHIKALLTEEKVDGDRKEAYSALMYTFHQALYDCLNRMLLDELIEGRNWINYPWSRQFKVKKLIIGSDHSKQCLQKAINRVSNISDYNIMPDVSQMGRDFEQTQHNLIIAEEVKQIPLSCEIQRGYVMYSLAKLIERDLIQRQVRIIAQLLFP